jgi:hypothetical protein
MNKAQEEALISMILAPAIALVCGGLGIGLAYVGAVPFKRLLFEFALVMCLLGLMPLVCSRMQKRKGKASFDERDVAIRKNAVVAAYGIVWVYFVSVCVISWWLVGPQGSVSVNVLPMALAGGLAIFQFVQGLATLIQYGWRGDGDK